MAEADVEYDCHYLGNLRVKELTPKECDVALDLLFVKLDQIQKRIVEHEVSKSANPDAQYGSPEYMKVALKLTQKGVDVTVGENVTAKITAVSLNLTDPATGEVEHTIPLQEIEYHSVVEGRDGFHIATIVWVQKGRQMMHAINGFQNMIPMNTALFHAKKACLKDKVASEADMADLEKEVAEGSEEKVVEFGIGLHRKSSLRVGPGAARKRSVNLRGKTTDDGEMKRRGSGLGKSLASLDEDGLPPPDAWNDAFGAISEDLFRSDDLDAIGEEGAEGLGGFDMGDVADAVPDGATPDDFGGFGDEEPAEEQQPKTGGFARKKSVYGGFG